MNIKSICIGMERSKIAGNCPGAGLDAVRMHDLLKNHSSYCELFQSSEAKRDNVVETMKYVCSDSDLAIIFYAGHGGSQKMKQYAPEEVDGKDEMIFLYDDILLDDCIWDIIKSASGKVFCMFDCCHSETMFRLAPPPIMFEASLESKPAIPDLLCWSGCADDKTSMGSSIGGQFTNTFLKHFNKKLTYDELWNKISSDMDLKKYEIVKCTKLLGEQSSFNNKLIFN